MTVTYKGMTNDFQYRVAEVNFNEETETTLVNRVVFFMEKVKGYKVDVATSGYAVCEVEDRKEFVMFAREWREAVRMIKNCMKFGF